MLLGFFAFAISGSAQETLLLRNPSISNGKIAFAYASDIWIVNKDGSNPLRLTVNPDAEFDPVISPDGKWVAFTGNYDGNNDVYVVPATGGMPKRLTYHPASDVVKGWWKDNVIYASSKETPTTRYGKLYMVNITTGDDVSLPMPEASQACISPDGKFIAYIKNPDLTDANRNYRPFNLYRGGLMPAIWIFNKNTYDIEEIPGSKGNNNTRPVWLPDGKIYFLSDRDNKINNIYCFDSKTKEVKKITSFSDYNVKTLQGYDDELVFEQAGRIHEMNPTAGTDKTISITLNGDLIAERPHWVDGSKFIRDIDISPTGIRAVVETRGEIVTIPVDKGDIRNLTNSSGTHERSPSWSPDGKYIAYFSDRDGEYDLRLRDQKGEKEEIKIDLGDGNFYYNPIWSNDSKKIVYSDKHLRLHFIDLADKKPVLIASDTYDRPDAFFSASWSPDNKWIAYNRKLKNNLRAIFIFNVDDRKSYQVTDGMSEAAYPVFSKDGKYLFFTASTNYGRSAGWLDMSSYEVPVRNSIYAVVLDKDNPSPLMPQSDEELVKDTDSASARKAIVKQAGKFTNIDLEHIDQRIVALNLPEKFYSNLQCQQDGKLFFIQNDPGGGSSALMVYDIDKRKADTYMNGVSNFRISADGKKLLYNAGDIYGIVSVQAKPAINDGKLKMETIKLWVDPQKEWAQIFHETWRIERDFFYVSNMHGADWNTIKTKYEKFLPYVAHREDLSYLLNQMMAELVIGHNYVSAGDYPSSVSVNVGLLGADYEVKDGRYQFKKIYQGLNWNPSFKSPLTQPGINIKEGDYLLAVNGIPLDLKMNVFSLFQNTAGKQTRILVNNQPNVQGAKEFIVVPEPNDNNLRLMNWVEENRRKVSELSNGKLAYVYLPNTAGDGYTFFNRYYYSQLDKQGVIVDERFNGGGSAADYIVDALGRKVTNYWKNRDGDIMKTPEAVIDGPMAMITNGYAGSGGDLLPFLFRTKKLGPLVGTTTHGILVGIYNYPVLMDGGSITAPRLGIFSTDGKWIIENEGVAPDIEVEQTPKEVINGHDPQLEKAVEIVMKEVKDKPAIKPPADPVRAVKTY